MLCRVLIFCPLAMVWGNLLLAQAKKAAAFLKPSRSSFKILFSRRLAGRFCLDMTKLDAASEGQAPRNSVLSEGVKNMAA